MLNDWRDREPDQRPGLVYAEAALILLAIGAQLAQCVAAHV